MATGKRRADLGRLTRLVEMLRDAGVAKFSEGDVTIEFAGPGIDYDRLADVLSKDEAARQGRQESGDRPMSDTARRERRRMPRDAQ